MSWEQYLNFVLAQRRSQQLEPAQGSYQEQRQAQQDYSQWPLLVDTCRGMSLSQSDTSAKQLAPAPHRRKDLGDVEVTQCAEQHLRLNLALLGAQQAARDDQHGLDRAQAPRGVCGLHSQSQRSQCIGPEGCTLALRSLERGTRLGDARTLLKRSKCVFQHASAQHSRSAHQS